MNTSLVRLGRRPLAAALAVPAFLLAQTLLAQTAAPVAAPDAGAPAPAAETVVHLDPFTVSTESDEKSFQPREVSSATRISTDLRDTPMAISVMTSALLGDVMSQNLREAAYFQPGVTGGQTNRTEFFNDETFRNIVSYRPYTDGSILLTTWAADEAFDVDRIEVIRGPSGTIFGSGNFGGLANKISKQPLTTEHGEALVDVGDNGYRKFAVDLTGPVPKTDKKLAFRLIMSYTAGPDTDRLDDTLQRNFIHASLKWTPDKDTVISLNFKAQLLNIETNAMGDVLEGNTVGSLYKFDAIHYDPNAPDPYTTHYSGTMLYLTVERNIGDWLSLRTLAAMENENTNYAPYSVPTLSGGYNPVLIPGGTGTSVPLPAGMANTVFRVQNNPGAADGVDQDILLKLGVAGISSKTLLTFNVAGLAAKDQQGGAEANYRTLGYLSWYYKNGPIGIPANFNPYPAAGIQSLPVTNWVYMYTKPSLSTTIQEFLSYWDGRINVSGGYSRAVQHGSETDLVGTTRTHLSDDFSANVIRYGASVRPVEWGSIYGQYNQGFAPPSPRVDPTNHTVFGPQTARNREGGIRLFFFKDRLTLTGDLYHMDLGGIITPYSNVTVLGNFQSGGISNNGWETSLQGAITPEWSITASVNEGDYVLANGRHNSESARDYGNFYTNYRFRDGYLKNLALGVGMYYKFRYVDGYFNDPVTGALTERDFPNIRVWTATASYSWKDITFSVHCTNLLNKFYYVTESSNIWDRGDGRHFTFETAYRF
jgi:iron complex outermembrane receptor protein